MTYIPIKQADAKEADDTTVAAAMIQNVQAVTLYRMPSAISRSLHGVQLEFTFVSPRYYNEIMTTAVTKRKITCHEHVTA